eukprot:2274138-Heterocapsa_arctica.AAC.1
MDEVVRATQQHLWELEASIAAKNAQSAEGSGTGHAMSDAIHKGLGRLLRDVTAVNANHAGGKDSGHHRTTCYN